MIGALEVTNRLGDIGFFTPDDVPVLETVAAHAAVALENSRLVDRLRHDAYHDALTTLPNRRRITGALDEAVKIRAPGEVVAVLLFDVDGLREVNESLGHAAGDKVLAEVADRLRASAPSAALVGRAGGDEFLVTLRLDERRGGPGARRRAARADPRRDGLRLAHPRRGHRRRGGRTPGSRQRCRDPAASGPTWPRQAAKSVPGSVQLFNPALESRSLRRLGLAGDLRRALDDGELEVYFQPKVALRDRRLLGVECLARWEHPTHGTVAPEDFVAVAEHTGQLGRLTEVVLREGLRRSSGLDPTPSSRSPSRSTSPRVRSSTRTSRTRCASCSTSTACPPQRLTLEITRGRRARRAPTGRCRPCAGCVTSAYGSRWTTSGRATRPCPTCAGCRCDEVKIDRSFVQGMATDPGDLAIVNAVVTCPSTSASPWSPRGWRAS